MTEGVRQLRAQSFDQALANFLEAYNKFPSPKILLNIASTLRDMGRTAEAANTYQRYLADPATGPERIAEVKQLLLQLDGELTLLTVRVNPRGAAISIDGGPFVAVGSALVTRVRPGIHTIRIRSGETGRGEQTINGFEGEAKDLTLVAQSTAAATDVPPIPLPKVTTPEQVDGWMVAGREYATSDPESNQRAVTSGYAGPVVAPIVPRYEVSDDGEVFVEAPAPGRRISSGVVGVLRIDGEGRGFAGGVGLALAPSDTVELELAGLRSNVWGLYAGIRLRFLTGWLRPYAAGGVPLFFFENDADAMNAVAIGLRGAGGLELRINGHLSVKADLGIEHFFNVDGVLVGGKRPDATVFVPTIGAIGRL
jgi:hypothetical protein